MRAPVPVSSVAVEHIHDRSCISIQHHKMWDLSPGVDAPRSEPLAALRQCPMQYPGFGVPRISLLGTSVNKARGKTGAATTPPRPPLLSSGPTTALLLPRRSVRRLSRLAHRLHTLLCT